MKGYTIENSIDLLEKDVKALKEGGGGGGASTWNQLQGKPFSALGEELYNLDGALTVNTISADKIALPESSEYSWDYLSQAVEALAEDVNHFSDDISDLEANKQDTLTPGNNITIENNIISALGSGYSISTTEVPTGKKFNGKDIYIRAYPHNGSIPTSGANIPASTIDNLEEMENIVNAYLFRTDAKSYSPLAVYVANAGSLNVRAMYSAGASPYVYLVFEYTKVGG